MLPIPHDLPTLSVPFRSIWSCLSSHPIQQRRLDSRTRTTTSTRFDLKFSRVFSNYRHPGKLHCTSFPKKISTVIFTERAQAISRPQNDKTSNTSKLVSVTTTFSLKLVVEWRQQSHFPAKMTVVHAQALFSIVKISYSSQNLQLSNATTSFKAFSHDVTSAVLVFKNSETAVMLVFLWELNLSLM